MPPEQDRNYLATNYYEQGQIGKGSFGHAYLVKSKREKALYVLKKVRLAKQTKWQRNSSLQEQELATSLQHPFIVPCVESWVVEQHTVFMIYAYCKHGDLANYLNKVKDQGGKIEEHVLKKWLCQLLLALDYLQMQKVLHRDVKTSNLLLTSDDDVQLGDFGLATLMDTVDGDESRPQDTNMVGTPHFMSPELLSYRNYGFKTDVWSLGCVFYELTAQRPSFNAFDIHGLIKKIKKYKPPTLPSSYSPEWRDVIALMLCKNPEARPSVQQLMALPALREAMLDARERARQLMPSVALPPLLDPTPLSPVPLADDFRSSDGQDGADDLSDGSAGSASDQYTGAHSRGRGSDADSSSKPLSSRTDRRFPAGLTAAQALQAHQLSELWKENFSRLQQGQLDSPEQGHAAGTAAPAAVQQQCSDQQESLDRAPCSTQLSQAQGLCAAGSSRGSLQTDSSSSSAATAPDQMLATGSVMPADTPPSAAAGVMDGCKRIANGRTSHVHQPGLNRSPSQRVAAAIAAAAGKRGPAAAADVPTGRVTPELCPRHAAPSPAIAKATRRIDSKSSSNRQATPGQLQQRPATAGTSSARQRPQQQASNAGSNSSSAAGTSRTPSTGVTPRQGIAASLAASDSNTVRRTPSSGTSTARRDTPPNISRHPCAGSILATPAAGGAAASSSPAAASRPLSAPRSSSLRRGSESKTPGSAAGPRQQQRPPWGSGRSCLTPGRQRPEPSPMMKALKLQHGVLGAAAAGAGMRPLSARVRSTTAADAGGGASKELKRSPGQLSPVLGGVLSGEKVESAAISTGYTAADGILQEQQQQQAQGTTAGLVRSASSGSAAGAAAQQRQQLAQGSAGRVKPGAAGMPPLALHKLQQADSLDDLQGRELSPLPLAPPVAQQDQHQESCAGTGQLSSSQHSRGGAALAHDNQQQQDVERLQLLESAMMVIGGLVERKRWVELAAVLRSPGLLPEGMYPGLAAEEFQQPQQQQQQSCAPGQLELGQIVKLGSREVRGIIRYIGPVASDPTGSDWVGLKLATPCATNSTKGGITYFECPPGCASFYKPSQLTAL